MSWWPPARSVARAICLCHARAWRAHTRFSPRVRVARSLMPGRIPLRFGCAAARAGGAPPAPRGRCPPGLACASATTSSRSARARCACRGRASSDEAGARSRDHPCSGAHPWCPSSSCSVSWGGDCVRPRALHGCGSVSPRWWRPSPASPRSFSAGVRVDGAGKAGMVPRSPWCSLGYRNQDPNRGSCGRACGRDGPRAPANACSSRRRRMSRGAPRSASRAPMPPNVPCGVLGR